MAISHIEDGRAFPLVNAEHITERRSDLIVFEILESDAGGLKDFLGIKQLLVLDDESFWGELVTLKPCSSTAAGLGLMRDRPTLRGTIRVFPGEPAAKQ